MFVHIMDFKYGQKDDDVAALHKIPTHIKLSPESKEAAAIAVNSPGPAYIAELVTKPRSSDIFVSFTIVGIKGIVTIKSKPTKNEHRDKTGKNNLFSDLFTLIT